MCYGLQCRAWSDNYLNGPCLGAIWITPEKDIRGAFAQKITVSCRKDTPSRSKSHNQVTLDALQQTVYTKPQVSQETNRLMKTQCLKHAGALWENHLSNSVCCRLQAWWTSVRPARTSPEHPKGHALESEGLLVLASLYPKPQTLNPKHQTPYTLNPLYPKPCTLNPIPKTLNLKTCGCFGCPALGCRNEFRGLLLRRPDL